MRSFGSKRREKPELSTPNCLTSGESSESVCGKCRLAAMNARRCALLMSLPFAGSTSVSVSKKSFCAPSVKSSIVRKRQARPEVVQVAHDAFVFPAQTVAQHEVRSHSPFILREDAGVSILLGRRRENILPDRKSVV